MTARARALIAKGMGRDAALDLALREGQNKARAKQRLEPKPAGNEPYRRPLTVKLGEAAKTSLLRQRRA